MDDNRTDHSTQSNFEEVTFTHCSINLEVDFESKTLRGFAKYTVKIKSEQASKLILDTKHLIIQRVEAEGTSLKYELGPEHEIFGEALSIYLPEEKLKKGAELLVTVKYSTTPLCTTVQWLSPKNTADKKYPYLFTQGQAINNRSLVPCQDCPAAKFTYDATIRAPKWATVLMSALHRADFEYQYNPSLRVFEWEQPVPISSYLLAIAVGHLESRDISPRCRVWAEPSVVDLAAHDYAQTEDFLQAAESFTCEYEWTRYDILCLPPSFPYGGMENPCLTFMTPTTLTGDRSLADVVAHEISHSWTGNLVTNYTWEHFWLNEGWTMWMQRKIMSKIHKKKLFFEFDAQIGRKSLRQSITNYGEDHEFTKLIPSLKDCDPDDAFSTVPYEKGFALLFYLQGLVGESAFETFAADYIQHFKFQILTSRDFKMYFLKYFNNDEKLKEIDWDAWFNSPGYPPVEPQLDTSLSQPSEVLASHWLKVAADFEANAISLENDPASADDIADWAAYQTIFFLDIISEAKEEGLPKPVLQAMDRCYNFTSSPNSEIKFRFLMICLKSGLESIVDDALKMAGSVGRMKFARPLYRELTKLPAAKEKTVKAFLENKDFYHPICKKMIGRDLGIPESELSPKPLNNKKKLKKTEVVEKKKKPMQINHLGATMASEANKSASSTMKILSTVLITSAIIGATIFFIRKRK